MTMFKILNRMVIALEQIAKMFNQHHTDVESQLKVLIKQTAKRTKKKKASRSRTS